MNPKQDRAAVRTAEDLERKYNLGRLHRTIEEWNGSQNSQLVKLSQQAQEQLENVTALRSRVQTLERLVRQIQEYLNLSTGPVTVGEINDMIVEYFESFTVLEVEA